ncbi:MAG: hypothetical protein QOD30_1027 [Actinomycetota bacterium]|nr:hypothetical protein [Actinomycetota bacterium]
MLLDGLPSELELPLSVLFGAPLPARTRDAAATIERARVEIAAGGASYRFERVGPDVRWPVQSASGGEFTTRELAHLFSVPQRWGVFLNLCAEAWGARTIVELGACVGISGAYLASTSASPRLVTLDAARDLVPMAASTLAEVTDRASVVVGPFEQTLGPAIESLSIDLAFVDGHHDGPATCSYVRTIAPHLAERALLILDDIRFNRSMWTAWSTLVDEPGVTATIDVGRFGLLVTGGGSKRPVHYDLSRWTGWWRTGSPVFGGAT